MANKRISELTTITGANLADADLLVVVDVSDTTMASSGTNKKVTLDEFAQDSTFSSRYKPLASDTIWLPAPAFGAVENSPSLGILGNGTDPSYRNPAWLFDTSTLESVGTYAFTPSGWATLDVYLWWSNAGAGAGDVVWQYAMRRTFADGDNLDSGSDISGGVLSATAAPLQYVAKRTKANTTALTVTAGTPTRLFVRRRTVEAADTLGNDAGLLAVELVRVS